MKKPSNSKGVHCNAIHSHMNKILTEYFALRGLLIILSALVVFHLLVLFKIIPFEIVWGSKISSDSRMYKLEAASIIISILMLIVTAIRAGMINLRLKSNIVNVIVWVMFFFFCLNTIGNLLSDNLFEKIAFAPTTFFLALFAFRVVRSKKQLAGIKDHMSQSKKTIDN